MCLYRGGLEIGVHYRSWHLQKKRNTKYIYPKLRNNCSKLRNKHENHFNLYNIAINLTKNIKKWKQIQCIENIENTKKTKKCKISIFNIFSIFWWFLLNFLQYLIIFMFISQLGANISPLGIYFGLRVLYLLAKRRNV